MKTRSVLLLLSMVFITFLCSCKDRSNSSRNRECFVADTFDIKETVTKGIDFRQPIEKSGPKPITKSNIKYQHKRINIGNTYYYLVEGDLLLNDEEYYRYRLHQEIQSSTKKHDTGTVKVRLVGEIKDGKLVKWPEKYTLTYSIIKSSFSDVNEYNTVKENMLKATRDWENTCNVKFFYDKSKDKDNIFSPPNDLTFIVAGFDADGKFFASSFFPYDPPERRRILIDPSYFLTNFDKTGVLRHELGHVIGFRHEHIRSEAPLACPDEILEGTINLTDYDPQSVMHYFCGDVGNHDLLITDVDCRGAQYVYGPPANKKK